LPDFNFKEPPTAHRFFLQPKETKRSLFIVSYLFTTTQAISKKHFALLKQAVILILLSAVKNAKRITTTNNQKINQNPSPNNHIKSHHILQEKTRQIASPPKWKALKV